MMLPVLKRITVIFLAGLLASTTLPSTGHAQAILIDNGAEWRYLDDGSNQDSVWRERLFDDSSWAQGPAQLGYGDGDESTVLSFGGNSSSKYITSYFRKHFSLVSLDGIPSLNLGLLRDDGAVVYLNGVEVLRSNMPAGTITFLTIASSTIGGASENTIHQNVISADSLVTGDNVIAVEIHQRSGTSSDISFALSLSVSDPNNFSITRGPYLQMATSSSQVIRWRTLNSGIGKVRYGLAQDDLNQQIAESSTALDHVISLQGLNPASTYYYEVLTNETAVDGNGVFHFQTPPDIDNEGPHRIWVLGDSGTADANAAAVRDGFRQFNLNSVPDLWLMLGDNAYDSGTDQEYQDAVFDVYPEELRGATLWPTLGNHDGISSDSDSQTGPYYDIFSLPSSGEAGGFTSGTEAYYSFDYGNIHFICLDSHDSDRASDGVMAGWLADDLAVNDKVWTVVFWHHPPYSKGSHDSDSDTRMTEMRENMLPLLEDAGVDLVLSGHSHAYERSFLIDGHYGISTSLTPAIIVDNGSGNPDTGDTYQKGSAGGDLQVGAVYIVAGSSGKTSGGPLNHPVMFTSQNVLGSVVLDVLGNELTARFIQTNGSASDLFAIRKNQPWTELIFLDGFE